MQIKCMLKLNTKVAFKMFVFMAGIDTKKQYRQSSSE